MLSGTLEFLRGVLLRLSLLLESRYDGLISYPFNFSHVVFQVEEKLQLEQEKSLTNIHLFFSDLVRFIPVLFLVLTLKDEPIPSNETEYRIAS